MGHREDWAPVGEACHTAQIALLALVGKLKKRGIEVPPELVEEAKAAAYLYAARQYGF